jgi:hypothetical protein
VPLRRIFHRGRCIGSAVIFDVGIQEEAIHRGRHVGASGSLSGPLPVAGGVPPPLRAPLQGRSMSMRSARVSARGRRGSWAVPPALPAVASAELMSLRSVPPPPLVTPRIKEIIIKLLKL